LQRAGILDSTQRGHFKISDRGREALRDAPERITINYLEKFPEFVEFRVPDTFQLGAISAATAFSASRFFNNLRVFNAHEYSDSPGRHQSFALI